MKRYVHLTGLVVVFSVLLGVAVCQAKPMKIKDTTDVYDSKSDILDSNQPKGVMQKDELVDAYYDDLYVNDGKTWVHAYGDIYLDSEEEPIKNNGYVDVDSLETITDADVRFTNELSPAEKRQLFYAATEVIHDETGLYLPESVDDLLAENAISFQVSDHCAVVAFTRGNKNNWKEKKEERDSFVVEFLFTMDEHSNGEYRTLYVERNGRKIFGGYEPLMQTDYTESLLGVDFDGFTYADNAWETVNESGEDIEVLDEYCKPPVEYPKMTITYRYVVVRNNTDETVDVVMNSKAYDKEGNLLGSSDGFSDSLMPNQTALVFTYFETGEEIDHCDNSVSYSKAEKESATKDLSFTQEDTENGAIFTIQNNGEKTVSTVSGKAVFLLNGEIVDVQGENFDDDEYEIKPGNSESREITTEASNYDSIEFYMEGMIFDSEEESE